jgi:hypothetical protein
MWQKEKLMKTALYGSALAVGLLAGQVCGASAQMINTVKDGARGSILVFPLIVVDPDVDTFIEISNDQTSGPGAFLKCTYVNERKGRDNFTFAISPGGSVSWDVKTLAGDHISPNLFPTSGSFIPPSPPFPPTSLTRGELICIATDPTFAEALAYNRLYGRATVLNNPLAAPATEPKQAFRYNSFNFRAWNSNLLAADGTVMGGSLGSTSPVSLPLTGALTGLVYDGCPAIDSTAFMPAGAALGGIQTVQNFVAGVGCNQDLTEPGPQSITTTQLNFVVEDSAEDSFSGAVTCVDSVFSTALGPVASVPWITNAQNFTTPPPPTGVNPGPDARVQVMGLANGGCNADGGISANVGLLTVFVSEIGLTTFPAAPGFDQIVANTSQTVGAESGSILFTPGP